ncbi:MAG: ABC transporter ATP-binding protein [Lachnospiraceae bacterium]|nr:ABC transporter ATP-binding protein [Lachnospiraceae bacterium]
MLTIEGLYKTYGKQMAVDGLSLHIPKGELFGFVGPNGAGKTTTIRIVCGLLKETGGRVLIDGKELAKEPDAVKRCIGYVPDFFGVYDNFKVSEYMEFYGSLYGISGEECERLTTDLLALVNLSEKREEYVDSLSRGMKQRLCVARALLHDPALLILDEPSSGLDPRARVEMKELLMNLNSMGKTIVISSHILSELSEMCTSIGIMDHGRLVAVGKIDDILNGGQSSEQTREKQIAVLEVSREHHEDAVTRLRQFTDFSIESVMENKIEIGYEGDEVRLNELMMEIMKQGVILSGFYQKRENLEVKFMQLTGSGEDTEHEA